MLFRSHRISDIACVLCNFRTRQHCGCVCVFHMNVILSSTIGIGFVFLRVVFLPCKLDLSKTIYPSATAPSPSAPTSSHACPLSQIARQIKHTKRNYYLLVGNASLQTENSFPRAHTSNRIANVTGQSCSSKTLNVKIEIVFFLFLISIGRFIGKATSTPTFARKSTMGHETRKWNLFFFILFANARSSNEGK